jgi:hypothetical protein
MKLSGIVLMAVFAVNAAAQEPRAASIEGVVVKLGSGEALEGATVQLNLQTERDTLRETGGPPLRPDANHRFEKTGRDGKFVFENVTPGKYQLIATRPGGYVPAEYGQRTPTGQGIQFDIASGQKMTGIQLTMSPTGSISGRVYDRDGEPLGRAQVQALQAVYKDGMRKLTIVQIVETNDRGEYRLFWLPPGRYYVSAKPDISSMLSFGANAPPANAVRITDPSRVYSYEFGSNPVVKKRTLKNGVVVEEVNVPVFYPGVLEAQAATLISVASGTTISGVDISVGPGVLPARHIRGRVLDGATGLPVAGARVMAHPRNPDPLFNIVSVNSDSNGAFDLAGLVSGPYALMGSNRTTLGIVYTEVGEQDLENIPVVVRSMFTIRTGSSSMTCRAPPLIPR